MSEQVQSFESMFSSLVRDKGSIDTRLSSARQMLGMSTDQILEFMASEPGMLVAQLSSVVGLASNFDPEWVEDFAALDEAIAEKNFPLVSATVHVVGAPIEPVLETATGIFLESLLESFEGKQLYLAMARVLWEVSDDADILPFLTASTQKLRGATTALSTIMSTGELDIRGQGNQLEDFIAKFGDDKRASDLMHRGLTPDRLVEILRDRGDWFSATVQIVDLEIAILALLLDLVDTDSSFTSADILLTWAENLMAREDFTEFLDWEGTDAISMRERLIMAIFEQNESDLRPMLRTGGAKTGLEFDEQAFNDQKRHGGMVPMVQEIDKEDRYHGSEDDAPPGVTIFERYGIGEIEGIEILRRLLGKTRDILELNSEHEAEVLRASIMEGRKSDPELQKPLKDEEQEDLDAMVSDLNDL